MADLLLIGGTTEDVLAALDGPFTVHRLQDMEDPLEWLDRNGDRIGYVLTNGHDGAPHDVVARMPNLKLISCYGVGYDAIDTAMANERQIMVTHTPNVLNAEVATTALMLLLASYRNLIQDDAHVRSGAWEREGNAPLSRSADNRTIGILGLGRIGQAIVDKLAPFNPTILYHGRTKKDVPYEYFPDLTEMARAADVLICVTPGGPATHHLVNRDVIEALGPKGTLINVSRGAVVDEAEMIAALQDGRLGWAALDVFEFEPRVPSELRAMSNVVLTPHVGSGTVETRRAMGALAVRNLTQHLEDGTVVSPVPECA